jgi:hypothetical protein
VSETENIIAGDGWMPALEVLVEGSRYWQRRIGKVSNNAIQQWGHLQVYVSIGRESGGWDGDYQFSNGRVYVGDSVRVHIPVQWHQEWEKNGN